MPAYGQAATASSLTAGRQVWGVAALLHAVSDSLAARFGAVTVRGEISGFTKAASGHCYLSLKDADGAGLIKGAMFRRAAAMLDFRPADGQLVEARGRLALYEPRGELQFVVESMQRAGAGALFEQFLRLKAKLEAEGLFHPDRKRGIPSYPKRIGVVTSLGAAVLHDVVTAFARRAPHVQVVVYPCLVQGRDAAASIVQALGLAFKRNEVDLLILCRGGGSLEDLWSFNEEPVVRAVAESPLPLICGVGHETDVSLCDFAADLRAATPTAAAELAAPATAELLATLVAFAELLQRRVRQRLDTQEQRLDRAALRLARPAAGLQRHVQALGLLELRLGKSMGSAMATRSQRETQLGRRLLRAGQVQSSRQAQRLDTVGTRLMRAGQVQYARQHQRLDTLEARLGALDPRKVLSRGYAWLTDANGMPVLSATQLAPGDRARAVLADGFLDARIDKVTIDPR
ncbi:MAG: exodeoxyribonuclease large subunit [Rhizobacter sp.]|nr:exodeoxyribonuclease large subunit [Rhizobacter sp.]